MPMKIVILTDSYPSREIPYAGVFIHKQAKALIKRGIDIYVLHLDLRSIKRRRRFGYYKQIYDEVNVYTCSLPCGPIPGILDNLYMISGMIALKKMLVELENIDLIHAHFTNMGMCAAVMKKKLSLPVILTEHSSALIKGNMSGRMEKMCCLAYNSADGLIAVGSNLKSKMQKFTDHPIEIIPNILSDHFHLHSVKQNDNFTFISVVGNITVEKRLHLLIEAFSKLQTEFRKIQLILLGGGNLLPSLKQQVNSLKLESSVSFKGTVENDALPEIYSKCHCFVLPSVFETFGVVYIEAAACGLPIIGSQSGGTADFICPDNGIIVENDNAEQLTGAMKYVLQHYEEYDRSMISKKIIEAYGEYPISEKIINCYNTILTRTSEDIKC